MHLCDANLRSEPSQGWRPPHKHLWAEELDNRLGRVIPGIGQRVLLFYMLLAGYLSGYTARVQETLERHMVKEGKGAP